MEKKVLTNTLKKELPLWLVTLLGAYIITGMLLMILAFLVSVSFWRKCYQYQYYHYLRSGKFCIRIFYREKKESKKISGRIYSRNRVFCTAYGNFFDL